MPATSARVEAWKSAWESRDPATVAALYAPDATHESALIARLYPELGRLVLRGRHEIAEYARRGRISASFQYRQRKPRACARTDRMARRSDQRGPRVSF